MDCGSVDLKAFSLGEASTAEKRAVELHVKSCGACRDELARLELTFASLGALRDEEIPTRIAFVSDKVFEPNWWQRLWNSGPQLGFASAGMLAAALVFHAVYAVQTPAAPVTRVETAAVAAAPSSMTEDQIQKRIEDAVLKAVGESEVRQQKRTVELLQAAEKRHEVDRQGLLVAFEDQTTIIQKRMNQLLKQNAGLQ
jgi:anti-sigma factor RsiW